MATLTRIEEKNSGNVTSLDRRGYPKEVRKAVNELTALTTEFRRAEIASSSELINRSNAPDSHRKASDSFMIIKKVFGHQVIRYKINEYELQLMRKLDLNPLELTTFNQIRDEITTLRKWSDSDNSELRIASDIIINIRVKELKNLMAGNFRSISNRVYDGYRALEIYLEKISKY